MNKRGQLFLIAALLIVSILLGLGTVYTKTQAAREETSVYALAEELKYEVASVIDYSTYSTLNKKNISENVNNLSSLYASSNPDRDIAIIYGDNNTLSMLYYKKGITSTQGNIQVIQNVVNVSLDNNFFTFNLTKGQNIFIIIRKDKGNESTIAIR